MPPVPSIVQELRTSLLDLLDGDRSPGFVGRYSLGNQMQRCLAHLAGQDGRYSRLLRCDSSGRLLARMEGATADRIGVIEANGDLRVSVWEATSQAPVKAMNDAGASTLGLCVTNRFLELLYSGLVEDKGPIGIVDHAGSNELSITATNEAQVAVSEGGDVAAVLGPGAAQSADNHLCVTGYELSGLFTILTDVYDPDTHSLRVTVLS